MHNPWIIKFTEFDLKQVGLREALCVLGNGYFAMRGAAEEARADGLNYPGTYLAGGFNQLQSHIAGQDLINEDLVNFPNGLPICFYPTDSKETWSHWVQAKDLQYQLELNMKQGILTRSLQFTDDQGRQTKIQSRRLVSMAHPHLAAIEYTILPLNWEGEIYLISNLDGSVRNTGVARYHDLNSQHLEILYKKEIAANTIALGVRTNQSHIEVVEAARTKLFLRGQCLDVFPTIAHTAQSISQKYKLKLSRKERLTVEKTLVFYDSRGANNGSTLKEARATIQDAPDFKVLAKAHQFAWQKLWQHCDIHSNVPDLEAELIHLHVFHLLQTISPHSANLDYGVPARGLHGEAYRGHVFWDELFIMPFYTRYLPEVARSLLLYRYHRLDAARGMAKTSGYQGAMYPWQSASTGEEVSQVWHFNPQSQTWGPDFSWLQRHVGSAIAYNIWRYYEATEDQQFLSDHGAKMFLEIARFWSSITTFNTKRQRYEICGVMGPDEFHEAYPNAANPGLNNNAYTNVMAVWVLKQAHKILQVLPQARSKALKQELNLSSEELKRWQDITHKMFIPFHEKIISQFEGYEALKELPWKAYRAQYANIERLDRILKGEGKSPNDYKLAKQADTVMLFYLLTKEELQDLFTSLGYLLTSAMIESTIDYYFERTSHGSSLSKIVFASVLAKRRPREAHSLYMQALHSDFFDSQQGTTQEGIHLGVMAGTLMYHFAKSGMFYPNSKLNK